MSTITDTVQPVDVFSRHIATGPRNYFFDVKRPTNGPLFFTISELVAQDNVWQRQRIQVMAEEARDFYAGLCETIKAMRAAAAELGIDLEPQAEQKGEPEVARSPAGGVRESLSSSRRHRGTGRIAQPCVAR